MTKRTKTPQRKLSSYGTTRIVIEMTQKGKPSHREMDKRRKALPPGRRISKAGNVYTERRPNRSDTTGERATYDRDMAWRRKAATLKKSMKMKKTPKRSSKKRK